MHFALCQAIEAELLSEDIPQGYSKRAKALLEHLREEFSWLEAGQTTVLVDSDRNTTWWTFAGAVFNAAMADALGDMADKVSSDNLAISLSKVVDTPRLKKRILKLLDANGKEGVQVPLDLRFIQELKFAECIPPVLINKELLSRYSCCHQEERFNRKRLRLFYVAE